jgi:hypothetical protein
MIITPGTVVSPEEVLGGEITAAPPSFTNIGHNLKNLLDRLTTSREAIPQRERPLPEVLKATSEKNIKERYELIKKITGDSEVARRIDYR